MNERLQNIFKSFLLAFVLISTGFALGRLSVSRGSNSPSPDEAAVASVERSFQVVVTYFHGDIRCTTCNKIERMVKECLEKSFGQEMKTGTVLFQDRNYDQDARLAEKYDVPSSMPVISLMVKGQEQDFTRMDAVWDLVEEPEEFKGYIVGTIETYIAQAGESQDGEGEEGGK